MEYVSQCPHCGCVLEKAPKLEPICPESNTPIQALEPAKDLPAPGKQWPCVLTGSITTAIALILFSMLFVLDEPLDPVGVTVVIVLLLVLLGFGLALLLCRHTEPEESRQPVVVLRERKIVATLDMLAWGFGFVMMLLAAGSVVPLLLYRFTDLKMSHTVYLTAFSPLPIALYYIAFTPVFSLGNPSAGATDEWKSMHIRFPMMLVVLFDLFIFAQVYHFWEERYLQIVDFGRFFLLMAVITALLIALCWVRTQKRMRRQDAFTIMLLSLVMLGFVVTYGTNLAISKPAEHYPAVVVDRHGPTEEHKDAGRTLTILLDDGTTIE